MQSARDKFYAPGSSKTVLAGKKHLGTNNPPDEEKTPIKNITKRIASPVVTDDESDTDITKSGINVYSALTIAMTSEDLFSTEPDPEVPTPLKLTNRLSNLLVGENSEPINLLADESKESMADTVSSSINLSSLPSVLVTTPGCLYPKLPSKPEPLAPYESVASTVVGGLDNLDCLDTNDNSFDEEQEEAEKEASIITLSSTDDEEEKQPVGSNSSQINRFVSQNSGGPIDAFFDNYQPLSSSQAEAFNENFHPRNTRPSPIDNSPQRVEQNVADDNAEPQEIPETEDEEEGGRPPTVHNNSSAPRISKTRQRRRLSSSSSSDSSPERTNIQLNLKIGLKINIQRQSKTRQRSRSHGELSNERRSSSPSSRTNEEENQSTPHRSDGGKFLDDDEQRILDEVYGKNQWLTPTLLKKMEGKRSQSIRDELNSRNKKKVTSIKAKYDLTACRSPETKSSSSSKNTATARKAQIRPRALQICDSDTISSPRESTDESWKATESDESSKKSEKPKKKTHRKAAPEVPDYSGSSFGSDDEEYDKISRASTDLDVFECKEKTKIPKTSKRQLFTQKFDDEECESEPAQYTPRRSQMDEAISKIKDDEMTFKVPDVAAFFLPRNKKLETPQNKKSGKENQKPLRDDNRKTLSFLQSLDVNSSQNVCHALAIMYRQSYKTKKEELATKLYEIFNEGVFESKLDVPFKWNKKLTQTAGICRTKKNRNGERSAVIELSEKVLTSADRLRCTLIHEMCHAATWIFEGQNGHGHVWKAWAAKANKVFPELPTIGTCHAYEIDYKYTYQCKICKAKNKAHSRNKKVENIRCRFCHGPIEILLNKKDKDGNIVATPVKQASGFAKYVKEQYKIVKKPQMKHAEVMKALSGNFAALSVDEKLKYK